MLNQSHYHYDIIEQIESRISFSSIIDYFTCWGNLAKPCTLSCPCTVKFLNFGMPQIFAVIYLKFKQRGQT